MTAKTGGGGTVGVCQLAVFDAPPLGHTKSQAKSAIGRHNAPNIPVGCEEQRLTPEPW